MALHPDVRKYYVFRTLVKRFVLPILVVYALKQGLAIEQIGFIAVAGYVLAFFLEVPSGSIADAIGHRRALVLSTIGQAASMALYLGGSFEWILVATLLYFGSCTLMSGTSEALFFERMRELGLEKDHLRLSGQGKGFATAVSIVFMVAAGWLYGIAWYLPFLVGVVQFLVAGIVISTFGAAPETISVSRREHFLAFFQNFRTAWQVLSKDKRLFWLTVSSAIILGTVFGLGDLQQAVMHDVGMTAMLIGFVYALKRLVAIFVQSYAHLVAARFSAPSFTLICVAFAVAHFFLAASTKNFTLMAIFMTLGTIGWTGLDIASNDYRNKLITGGARATTLSASYMMQNLTEIVAVLCFTTIAGVSSSIEAYGSMGIVLAVTILIPLIMLTRAYKKTA